MQGSAQLVGLNKVKKDPRDKTVSISILITKALGADFDGEYVVAVNGIDNSISINSFNCWDIS